MKLFTIFAAALFPFMVSAGLPCPDLHPASGFHWEGRHGPGDEIVCIAVDADGTTAFILFRGNTPPLLAEDLTRAEVGMALGQPVRWYEQGPDRDYQAELFLDTSLNSSIRVFIPRSPAGTFLQRVRLVGALPRWPKDYP